MCVWSLLKLILTARCDTLTSWDALTLVKQAEWQAGEPQARLYGQFRILVG